MRALGISEAMPRTRIIALYAQGGLDVRAPLFPPAAHSGKNRKQKKKKRKKGNFLLMLEGGIYRC